MIRWYKKFWEEPNNNAVIVYVPPHEMRTKGRGERLIQRFKAWKWVGWRRDRLVGWRREVKKDWWN